MYEWRTGSVPKKIEKNPNVSHAFGDEEQGNSANNEDKIDFDVVDFNVDTINMENPTEKVFELNFNLEKMSIKLFNFFIFINRIVKSIGAIQTILI